MLLELRAARQWQVRPSEFRKWDRADRAQAVALTDFEASIGKCGHSHARTMDAGEDLGGGWLQVVSTGVCPGCAALDEWQRDSTKKDPDPGAQFAVVNTRDHPQFAID